MKKNVLVISTSLRNGSNSETLAKAFVMGAQESGHVAELISLRGKNIGFCKGCLACQTNLSCVINDDVSLIAEKVKNADVIAFSTPVYFYEMSGQMKTLLDRLNPLFPSEYKFRDVYLMAAAADSSEQAMDGVVKGMEGFINCFGKSKLKGVVIGLKLEDPDEAESSPYVNIAFEMGKNI